MRHEESTLGKHSERHSWCIGKDMQVSPLKFASSSDSRISRVVPVHGTREFVGWGHSARRASACSSGGLDS